MPDWRTLSIQRLRYGETSLHVLDLKRDWKSTFSLLKISFCFSIRFSSFNKMINWAFWSTACFLTFLRCPWSIALLRYDIPWNRSWIKVTSSSSSWVEEILGHHLSVVMVLICFLFSFENGRWRWSWTLVIFHLSTKSRTVPWVGSPCLFLWLFIPTDRQWNAISCYGTL